jgi:hypothetical protein
MNFKRASSNLALLAVMAFLIFPFYSGSSFAGQRKERSKKPLAVKKAVNVIELSRIDQLKQDFQRDAGKVRFVTILSPT